MARPRKCGTKSERQAAYLKRATHGKAGLARGRRHKRALRLLVFLQALTVARLERLAEAREVTKVRLLHDLIVSVPD